MMARSLSFRQHILPSLVLGPLALGLAVVPANASAAQHSVSQLAGTSAAGACVLPLLHDRYDGFHIGVPAGWGLSTLSDTIFLTKDPTGSEAAVVYPALLTKDLTPARLFAAYSHTLQQSAAQAGNALSFHLTSKAGQLPQAVVTGRAGHTVVQGRAVVSLLRNQTAVSTAQVVFSAYWAPVTRIAADGPMLASIVRCYGPERGTLYQVYQDQVFAFALPEQWHVAAEGQDNLEITGDSNRAVASFLLTLLPTSETGTTPRSLLSYLFGQLHIQIGAILASAELSNQQTADGATQAQERLEFTGQYNGKAVHGLVYVTSVAGSAVTGGTMRLAMATVDQWNAVNSGLIKVMTSIQHNMTQDNQQWSRLTQQWQQFDQTTQQFDDVLNGVQEVQDPTTGTLYAAPYDTYEVAGPNGPGYYVNDGGFQQRLQPVNQ
jgi:hypothetical protein